MYYDDALSFLPYIPLLIVVGILRVAGAAHLSTVESFTSKHFLQIKIRSLWDGITLLTDYFQVMFFLLYKMDMTLVKPANLTYQPK